MAGVVQAAPGGARQLSAIAWLRGRLFLNTFRRKGGKSEVVARLLLFPLFALFAAAPIAGAGFGAFFIAARHEYRFLPLLTWLVFFLWQTYAIATQAASAPFDLTSLIRFPMRFSTYLAVRLLFGLLETPTVVCSLTLLSAAIGFGIARPSLFPGAALVLFVFDLAILFFFRMILLWFDRWFAQRRTREILMGVFFVALLGFQYVNLTVNVYNRRDNSPVDRARHAERVATMTRAYHVVNPVLRILPPGLAASALNRFAVSQPTQAAPALGLLLLWGASFFSLFCRRLLGEFNGESFSEGAARPAKHTAEKGSAPEFAVAPDGTSDRASSRSFLPPVVTAVMAKELRYLRRSGPLLLQLFAPIFMVFIIVARTGIAQRGTQWLLPSVLAYVVLGLVQTMYNAFGIEGAGINLYFLAPVRLRDVVVAKNIFSLAVILLIVLAASAIVLTTTGLPAFSTLCATYLWLAFTLAVQTTVGNIRSVYSPSLIDLSKFRNGRKGQINALLGMGVLLLSLGLGAGVVYLAHHLSAPWLPVPVFLVLAGAAIAFYRANLNHLEQIALDRREVITGELCRS